MMVTNGECSISCNLCKFGDSDCPLSGKYSDDSIRASKETLLERYNDVRYNIAKDEIKCALKKWYGIEV